MEETIAQIHVTKSINSHKNKLIRRYKKVYKEIYCQNPENKEDFQNVAFVVVQHIPNTHVGN